MITSRLLRERATWAKRTGPVALARQAHYDRLLLASAAQQRRLPRGLRFRLEDGCIVTASGVPAPHVARMLRERGLPLTYKIDARFADVTFVADGALDDGDGDRLERRLRDHLKRSKDETPTLSDAELRRRLHDLYARVRRLPPTRPLAKQSKASRGASASRRRAKHGRRTPTKASTSPVTASARRAEAKLREAALEVARLSSDMR